MAEPLTPREQQCLLFIKEHLDETGVAPTQREIGAHLGTGGPGANFIVRSLHEKGHIEHRKNRHRSIKLVAQDGMVTLSPEIDRLVSEYAKINGIKRDVAACELLRGALGAA